MYEWVSVSANTKRAGCRLIGVCCLRFVKRDLLLSNDKSAREHFPDGRNRVLVRRQHTRGRRALYLEFRSMKEFNGRNNHSLCWRTLTSYARTLWSYQSKVDRSWDGKIIVEVIVWKAATRLNSTNGPRRVLFHSMLDSGVEHKHLHPPSWKGRNKVYHHQPSQSPL